MTSENRLYKNKVGRMNVKRKIRNNLHPSSLVLLLTCLLLSACSPGGDTSVPVTMAVQPNTVAEATTPTGRATMSPAGSRADIRIGLLGPFTGSSASLGQAIKRGATMAVDDINKAGGINGRKIVLIERDDKATPAEAVTNVKDLIEKEKVLALFGTANTAVGLAQAPIVQQAKVVWAIPVATGTKITEGASGASYIFRLSMADRYQSRFVVNYVTGKYKRIVVIHDDSDYGTLGGGDLAARFKEKQVDLLAEPLSYKAVGSAEDMKALIMRLKELDPDVVINWGLGATAANIKKAMRELNADYQMIGSWGLSMPEFPGTAQGAESGTIVAQTFTTDTTNPRQLEFITRYKAEFKTEKVDFPSGTAQAYDLMHLLGEALKQPGAADDRDKLRAAMANLGTYDGIIKKYDQPFANPIQDALTDQDFFLTVWRDGKLVRMKDES
jgi:branched-chain amino acid transport system substrate-binding protein